MLRILLYSDSARWTTGFGHQTRWLGQWLTAQGHDVVQIAFAPSPVTPDQLTPDLRDPGFVVWDQPGMTGWERVVQTPADLVISLLDDFKVLDALYRSPGKPWIRWSVYDGSPIPLAWQPLNALSVPVAVSPYTQHLLAQAEWGEAVRVIPHAVDLEWFHPPSAAERASARQRFFPHDPAFVMSYVGRASTRKQLGVWFETLARVRERDDSVVGLVRAPKREDNVDYEEYIHRLGLYGAVTWLDTPNPLAGVSAQWLRDLYWASDVLVHPARSEGFGLTLLEARACGVPTLCSRYSAMADWATPEELLEPRVLFWEGLHQIQQAQFDVDEAVKRLLRWKRRPDQREGVGARARQRVQACAPDIVGSQWSAAWENLVSQAASRLYPVIEV